MGVNANKKTCRLKPRFLEYSDYKAEAYRKQLWVVVKPKEKGGIAKQKPLFHWDVPKPSEDLIEAYEEKKLAFTNRLNKNISERLNRFEDSGKSMVSEQKEEVKERKPLTERQEEVMRVLAQHKYKEASEILGMSLGALHQNKQLALKKGYTLKEFREK